MRWASLKSTPPVCMKATVSLVARFAAVKAPASAVSWISTGWPYSVPSWVARSRMAWRACTWEAWKLSL